MNYCLQTPKLSLHSPAEVNIKCQKPSSDHWIQAHVSKEELTPTNGILSQGSPRDPSSQLLLLADTLPLCCFLFPKLLLPPSRAVAAALQAQSPGGRSCRAAAGAQPGMGGCFWHCLCYLMSVRPFPPHCLPPLSTLHDIVFKYASVTFHSTEYCGSRSLSVPCFLANRTGKIKTWEMHRQTKRR